ncbi:MAG: ABC transporter substrate-binding protein [Bacteroidota bacterium]
MKPLSSILALVLFTVGCSIPGANEYSDDEFESIPLKYATGFTIEKAEDFYVISIKTPFKGATQPLTYVFYDKFDEKPDLRADAYIPTPVESIVCTSTTHIPLLDYLEETEALTGFPTTDYISSDKMRKRIDTGVVEELGIDEALNIERLISIKPELVMGYSLSGDYGQFSLIEEAGIPVVLNAEYLEQHPLGRSEWIKVAGILFDKLDMADSVFNSIEREYQSARNIAKTATENPTVMSGIVYGDSWFVPGGNNYSARLLKDAGFKYLWGNDTSSAFLALSFETVYDKAHNADYWIGISSFTNLDELAGSDNRYESFAPFVNNKVYSFNKRMGAAGGSEFLELGYLRPDIILKDLVKIGHPDLLPDHELFFHFPLPN